MWIERSERSKAYLKPSAADAPQDTIFHHWTGKREGYGNLHYAAGKHLDLLLPSGCQQHRLRNCWQPPHPESLNELSSNDGPGFTPSSEDCERSLGLSESRRLPERHSLLIMFDLE